MNKTLRKYAAWAGMAGLALGALAFEPGFRDNSIAYKEVQRKAIRTWKEYVEITFPAWAKEAVYGEMVRLIKNDDIEIRHKNKAHDIGGYESIASAYEIPEALFISNTLIETKEQKAESKRGAAGDFQLMPKTAKSRGLRIDSQVDERYGWMAPYAAAEEIEMLGMWLCYEPEYILSAWNWGLGNVVGEIAGVLVKKGLEKGTKQEVKDRLLSRKMPISPLPSFWEVYHHLPVETKEHVFRDMAGAIIYENPGKYGVNMKRNNPSYVYYPVSDGETLQGISRKLKSNPKELQELNLHVKNWRFKKRPKVMIRYIQHRG